TTGRDDQTFERAEQPARIAVGGDDDMLRVELVERLDAALLPEVGAGLRGENGESPYPARRLDCPVGRMEHRRGEQRPDRLGELLAPLDREAVLAQQLVLA